MLPNTPMHQDSQAIYLDHAATTPVRPEVAAAMATCVVEDFGNPSSRHTWGRSAKGRLEEARSGVADSLGVSASTVYFTRGGTESDNLAVLGRARSVAAAAGSAHVVTSSIEHPAVLEAAHQAVREGGTHTVVGFDGGAFDMDALRRVLRERPAVVSCMWVNNETGMVLPIPEIAAECRAWDVPLHSDAVQAAGKMPLPAAGIPADLLTVTGHKIYGPKGTGALIVDNRYNLCPLHFGGGQERGLRPGTEDVAGAVGLAVAIKLAVTGTSTESARLTTLREEVETGLVDSVPGLRVNGRGLPRAPHILSLSIQDADSDTLLAALDTCGIAASGGSACASGSSATSPSLAVLGFDAGSAALRLSFGRLNSHDQVGRIVAAVAGAVERTRALVVS